MTNLRIKDFGWQQWALVVGLSLALAVTALFAVRTVRRAIYWRIHHDEAIRPWMSVPYVAHSYRVPPQVLYEALGVTPTPHDRRPIREIAKAQNRSVDAVIFDLQNAIARDRASHSPDLRSPSPDRGRSP